MPDPLARAIAFLEEIAIDVRIAALPEETFLPGVTIAAGAVAYDPQRLRHPGDILHEAGHLAVMPAEARASATAPLASDGGDEMAAIAWSYAACRDIGIDARFVFHPDGYRGASEAIYDSFSRARYFGVPLLAAWGMCVAPPASGAYPRMLRWLR